MQDRIYRILPYAALAVAAALVVLLGWQKRGLITDLEQAQYQLREARTMPIRGMWMPAFQAPTLEGQQATIGEVQGEGRQVLMMYTTSCPFCLSSIPAWKQIKAATDTMTSIRAAVYGVSLDSVNVTREYIAKHQLPYQTVRFPDEKVAGMYRAGTVPVTLVLDERGRTIYSRTGELKDPVAIDSVMQAIRWRPTPQPADSARPAAPAAPGQTGQQAQPAKAAPAAR
jgi:peroxiredoxin